MKKERSSVGTAVSDVKNTTNDKKVNFEPPRTSEEGCWNTSAKPTIKGNPVPVAGHAEIAEKAAAAR